MNNNGVFVYQYPVYIIIYHLYKSIHFIFYEEKRKSHRKAKIEILVSSNQNTHANKFLEHSVK